MNITDEFIKIHVFSFDRFRVPNTHVHDMPCNTKLIRHLTYLYQKRNYTQEALTIILFIKELVCRDKLENHKKLIK